VKDIRLDADRASHSQTANGFLPEGFTLEQWEDEMIREALQRSHGNKSQAARLLGLSRNACAIGCRRSVFRRTEAEGESSL